MDGITTEGWVILPAIGVCVLLLLWIFTRPWRCPICQLTEWEGGSYRDTFKIDVPPYFVTMHRSCFLSPKVQELLQNTVND